ncbi:MAG: NeuD/PglB/VioB family sugar acetyltransferase [Planctomycetota bacterium]
MKSVCSLIGAGGHGKVVARVLLDLGFVIDAVYDDNPTLWETRVLGIPVVGPIHSLAPGMPAVIAIGDNRERARIASVADQPWQTLVHPSAHVDPTVTLGPGTVVMPKAAIQVDAVLGRHVIVNTSATIEHDCQVGDFAHIAPGTALAGAVGIGEGVLMGVGTSTRVGARVGDWSVVGAGSVVVRDVPAHVNAYGIPAQARGSSNSGTPR